MEILSELPALVVLERIPVPAVDADGAILFANRAFAAMVDRSVDAILALTSTDVFHVEQPNGESAVSVVRARMSRSTLVRDGDPVALATFQDLTERLWTDEL
jgi:PAS domain-containing protein